MAGFFSMIGTGVIDYARALIAEPILIGIFIVSLVGAIVVVLLAQLVLYVRGGRGKNV